jgi:hypothetical protein
VTPQADLKYGLMDLAILNAEAAAGMYKKPVEVLAREIHYEPLPPDVRMLVIAAWERGGLMPKRIRVAARYIKMGVVRFPRTGCEQLMTQLLGFGSEKHDDAVDALVYLILGLVGQGIEEQKIQYV